MLLDKSGARELSWVSNAPSFGAVFGSETEATCGAVKEKAGTELRGRNPGPGVSWSTCDGEADTDCGSAENVLPGTEIEKDENGITGTVESGKTPTSALCCSAATVLLDRGVTSS